MSEIYLPEAVKRRNATLGSETRVYFERISDGHLVIPMVPRDNPPFGYVRMEADSAQKLDQVSRRFRAQKKREFALIDEDRCRKIEAYHKDLRGKLHHAMAISKSQYEKDFITLALKHLEEGEENLRQRNVEVVSHIEAYEAPR